MRMNTPKRSFLHGIGIKYFITAIIGKPRHNGDRQRDQRCATVAYRCLMLAHVLTSFPAGSTAK